MKWWLQTAGYAGHRLCRGNRKCLEHGRDKLLRKGADAIVLNDVSRPGIGFDSDRNAATFLTPKTAIELPEMTKHQLASASWTK